ncbi:MAG: carboxypeptidase-like regulatory domain-containing protein, partial [Gemmatimonadaceae bacterium]
MVNAHARLAALATVLAFTYINAHVMFAQTRESVAPVANATATGRVRGTVFDSLLMKPLARASVWVAGGTQSTVTDSLGRFDLGDVPAGAHTIAFSSASLDSLGLPTNGKSLNVAADGAHQITLNTPSFRSIWRALCGSA